MISITCGGTTLEYDEATLALSITRNGQRWDSLPEAAPTLTAIGHEAPVPFTEASSVTSERRSFGTGEGVVNRFIGLDNTA